MERLYSKTYINRVNERKAVLEEIKKIQDTDDSIIIFLKGKPGIGKSSFAEEVAFDTDLTFVPIEFNCSFEVCLHNIKEHMIKRDNKLANDFKKKNKSRKINLADFITKATRIYISMLSILALFVAVNLPFDNFLDNEYINSIKDYITNNKSIVNLLLFIVSIIIYVYSKPKNGEESNLLNQAQTIKFINFAKDKYSYAFLLKLEEEHFNDDSAYNIVQMLLNGKKNHVILIETSNIDKFKSKFLISQQHIKTYDIALDPMSENCVLQIFSYHNNVKIMQEDIISNHNKYNFNLKELEKSLTLDIQFKGSKISMIILHVLAINKLPLKMQELSEIISKESLVGKDFNLETELDTLIGENLITTKKNELVICYSGLNVLKNNPSKPDESVAKSIIREHYQKTDNIYMLILLSADIDIISLEDYMDKVEALSNNFENFDNCKKYLTVLSQKITLNNNDEVLLKLSAIAFNMHLYDLSFELISKVKEIQGNYQVLHASNLFKQGYYKEAISLCDKYCEKEKSSDKSLLLLTLKSMSLKQLEPSVLSQHQNVSNIILNNKEYKSSTYYPYFLRFHAESCNTPEENINALKEAKGRFVENNNPLQAIHTDVNIAMYMARDQGKIKKALKILNKAKKELKEKNASSLIVLNNINATLLLQDGHDVSEIIENLKAYNVLNYNPYLKGCITINLISALFKNTDKRTSIVEITELMNMYDPEIENIPKRLKYRVYFNALCFYKKTQLHEEAIKMENNLCSNDDLRIKTKIENNDYTPVVQFDSYWNFELPIRFYEE